MATLTPIDLLINTAESASNLKEIRDIQKQIRSEMLRIGEDGGEQFDKLAAASAKLKDRVEEVKERVDQLNPDKFSALDSAARIGATGINLITGAMGFLGDQSEDTQKALLQVQQAMAFAQGLSGIKDLKKEFANLWITIAKNPIAALVVGLATLAVGAYKLYDAFFAAGRASEQLAKNLEKQKEINKQLNAQYDAQITILESQADSEHEVYEAKKAKLQLNIEELKQSYALHAAKIQEVYDNDSIYESYLRQTAAGFKLLGLKEEEAKVTALLTASKKESAKEASDAAKEEFNQILQFSADLIALNNNENRRQSEESQKAREKDLEDQKAYDQHRLELYNEYLRKKEEAVQAELARRRQQAAEEKAIADEWLQMQIEAQAELDAKMQGFDDNLMKRLADRKAAQMEFANAAIGIFSALEGLTKKGSAANKALALADIAAGTAVGFINALDIAQKSAKATGPAAAFAFPIFYASQIAAVLAAAARARDVLRGGTASSGGGSGGGGAPSISIPENFNQEPAGIQPTTPIDVNGNPIPTNNQPQGPQQVFVVETDITRATGRVAVLENNLTLR